ncbi:MAG: oligogalacturonide lyase [Puniceicoccaceae bacterium 5H]|nr:MAG: oligogalacturonide lyase [Puniceicoccaceae bacterium 5H]
MLLQFATLAMLASPLLASNFGKVYPSEKRTMHDEKTGVEMIVLTEGPASDSKPYQTHTTWTVDHQWIIFRSDRGDHGRQIFLVNQDNGKIIQLTDEPDTNVGSINLSEKSMKLYYTRGGKSDLVKEGEERPEELVELDLAKLIPDALKGNVKDKSNYERVVVVLPEDLHGSGGMALDPDDSAMYWGVGWAPSEAEQKARAKEREALMKGRRDIDQSNTDPNASREAARKRFELNGRGPGGIRRIDIKTGEITKVIDVDFRMGHVQTNPWKPGEIIYCHETTGDAPQRMWMVQADGSGNRPVYPETEDEWITHETVCGKDELMFNIMGHLPYLRERPTGIAVVNLRTNSMKILGQVEEDLPNGTQGGFWHSNGSPDGEWAVGDTFEGNVFLIDRDNGKRTLLTTNHQMRPDHTHPIFSPDSQYVLIQSGMLSQGENLDLIMVPVPEKDHD